MEEIQNLAPHDDDLIIAAYRYLLESGKRDDRWLSKATGAPLDRVEKAYQQLEDLQVIEPRAAAVDGWRAVEPQVAMARLVLPMEAEALHRAAEVERLRNLFRALVPVHEAVAGAQGQEAIEIVTDDATLEALLDVEINKCTEQILLLQPSEENLCLRVDQALGALGRGVTLRGIFLHGARYHRPTQDVVKLLGKYGARFGTADELPVRLVALDSRCCLLCIPETATGAASAPTVTVVVRHPLVISQFMGIFVSSWDQAVLFSADDPRPTPVVDQLKQSILRLLASGVKDDVIARRLGLSVRTCRRHISDLMDSLNVSSRFQAGVKAGALGLVPAPAREPTREDQATVRRPAG